MAQMWNLDPVPVRWVRRTRKLANGRQWSEKRPVRWQLEIVVGPNKGQHEPNAGKTGHLEYSSINAAVRGMQCHGMLLDLCDVCELPGTDNEPLADFKAWAHGDMLPGLVMAHEECGEVNGWELS